MTAHLNDLEAERLTALVELDQAQGKLESFRANAISTARDDAQKKLQALEEKIDRCNKQLEELKAQINALAAQRDALQDEVTALQQEQLPKAIVDAMTRARMTQPVQGTPLYLRPRAGEAAGVDVLTARFMKVCADSGIPCDKNAAIAALALLTVSSRIGIACSTPAAAKTLLENITGAMGWRSGFAHQDREDQRPVLETICDDGTPAVCLSTTGDFPAFQNVTSLCLARDISIHTYTAAFDCDPWPILSLDALPFVAQLDAANDGTPLSLSELTIGENDYDVHALETLKPILELLPPLSGKAAIEMKRFVTICARTMDGGLPAACDWAITLWLLPRTEDNPKLVSALKPLLAEYPVSAARL